MSSTIESQTPQEIVREILPLKNQRRIDPSAFLSLVDRLGLTQPEPRIYFLRELSAIVRQLPLKAFQAPEERLRLVDAIQQALDEAIDQEDAQDV